MLHSNKYRKKFEILLKFDFPRIPFVNNFEPFKTISEIGRELANLHLMKKTLKSNIKFNKNGPNVVESVKYNDGKVYINSKQSFDGVPEDAWKFRIGCYHILNKWLKDRRNRELYSKEVDHFIQMVEIINNTIDLIKKIEKIDNYIY